MLRQRVITAVVLLVLLVATLVSASHWPFALLTLVFISAAGWEWARLNEGSGAWAVPFAALLACACMAALLAGWTEGSPPAAWWTATAVWTVGGALALRGGPAAWPRVPRAVRWAIGLVGLWAAWLAMAHSHTVGINFMLSVFCVVWIADIAAYFGGRALGRRKLAPSISPGKSWEGVWSGMAGVLLLAALWWWAEPSLSVDGPSLFRRLVDAVGVVGAAVALLVLAGAGVVGDLIESLVKRACGAKDSSRLLPGHGGVLDRIDALLPVFPMALAFTGL